MIDLFEHWDELPDTIRPICDHYSELYATKGLEYSECEAFLNEIQPFGYTFDYGLDALPINLKILI